MRRLSGGRFLAAVLVGTAMVTSVACEGVVVATVTPEGSPAATAEPTPGATNGRETATPAASTEASPTVTARGTELPPTAVVKETEVSGTASPVADVTPTATLAVRNTVEAPTSTPVVTGTAATRPTPTATAVQRPTSTPTPRVAPTATATGRSATPTAQPTTTGGASGVTIGVSLAVEYSKFEGGQLLGADDIFLADLVPYGHSVNSVCDPASEGGSPFGATSIFNDFSVYGGLFGASSPFNTESTSPPAIVVNGEVVGHLSRSPFIDDAVDPDAMLQWLGCPQSTY